MQKALSGSKKPAKPARFCRKLISYSEHFVFTSWRRRPWWRSPLLLAGVALLVSPVGAAMDPALCHIPPFLETRAPIKPNIFLLVDNSGSMNEEAYSGEPTARFDPSREYYGYFDPDRCYRYSSNRWQPGPAAGPNYECTSAADPFSGNFMNWMLMSRLEVTKKALVGGLWNGASGYLQGESHDNRIWASFCFDASPWTDLPAGREGIWFQRATGSDRIYLRAMDTCYATWSGNTGILEGERGAQGYSTVYWNENYCETFHCVGAQSSMAYNSRLRVNKDEEQVGLLQRLQNQARWGMGVFNLGTGPAEGAGTVNDGGRIEHYYGFNVAGGSASLINKIRTLEATTWTPTAESLYEMIRFHRQEPPAYRSTNYNVGPANRDPFIEWEGSGDTVYCRKTAILVLTDGEPTQDLAIPSFLHDYAGFGVGHRPSFATVQAAGLWPPPTHPEWNQPFNWPSNGSQYIIDVAAWGRQEDHRPDLPGVQNIHSYFVYTFGREPEARYTLWHAAIQGSFIDKNGNGIPDLPNEWDENGDGQPDGFFIAEDGNEIETALTRAIAQILKRTSSGSSVAVLGASGEGEGAVVQAYFLPEATDGATAVTWLGFSRGLWLDKYGNLRQDSSGPGVSQAELVPDHRMVLTEDKIIRYRYDNVQRETMVELYADPDGNGVTSPSDLVTTVTIHELGSLFEVGQQLHERSAASRNIYTPLGFNGGMRRPFEASEAWLTSDDLDGDGLSDWLDFPVGTSSENLIRYIRGESASSLGEPLWRGRELRFGDTMLPLTWKLGDVIHSTPVLVGAPSSRFDLIYGDESYSNFFAAHAERPQIVYMGANDGMLHTFYLGTLRSTPPADKPNAQVWYDPACPTTKYSCIGDPEIGEEIWGWVPTSVLPYLRYLTEVDYCHMYFVDGPPQVVEARIFDPDSRHVDGWGTLLVGTMRLGCPGKTLAGRTFRSAVFVIDITDPFDPQPVFEYSHPELGFTWSQPVVSRIAGDWFLLFGSGPRDYRFRVGASTASLFAANLSGFRGGGPAGIQVDRIPLPGAGHPEWTNRPVAIDLGLSYDVDLIYLSTSVLPPGGQAGRILRILPRETMADPTTIDTSKWTVREAFLSDSAFSTAPVYGYDAQGNGWLFAGSGRYLDIDDRNDSWGQRFIGLREPCLGDPECTIVSDESDLVNVRGCALDLDATNQSGSIVFDSASCEVSGADTPLEVCQAVAAARGWRLEYAHGGERTTTRAQLRGRTVLAPTYTPELSADICVESSGIGRLYFLDQQCGITIGMRELDGDPREPRRVGGNFIIPGEKGEQTIIPSLSSFDELAGVQLFMTPSLEVD